MDYVFNGDTAVVGSKWKMYDGNIVKYIGINKNKSLDFPCRFELPDGTDIGLTRIGTYLLERDIAPNSRSCAWDIIAPVKSIPDLEAEVAGLRKAISDAGFAIMKYSNGYSVHDVSEKAKYDEERTNEVINQNIELGVQVREMEHRLNRLGLMYGLVEGFYEDNKEPSLKFLDALPELFKRLYTVLNAIDRKGRHKGEWAKYNVSLPTD